MAQTLSIRHVLVSLQVADHPRHTGVSWVVHPVFQSIAGGTGYGL